MFSITIDDYAFYKCLIFFLQNGTFTKEEHKAAEKFLNLDPEKQRNIISQALEDNATDKFWDTTYKLLHNAVYDIINDNKN